AAVYYGDSGGGVNGMGVDRSDIQCCDSDYALYRWFSGRGSGNWLFCSNGRLRFSKLQGYWIWWILSSSDWYIYAASAECIKKTNYYHSSDNCQCGYSAPCDCLAANGK